MYSELCLYIDGRFISAGAPRPSEPVFDPATGSVLAELPHATRADCDDAVDAAIRAFPLWRARSAFERGAILRKAANLLRDRTEFIARVLTSEQGKPLAESMGELTHAIELFDWFAEEGRRAYGRIIPARATGTLQIMRSDPIGPCAIFTPWNFPALTPARKLAAGLAAGCTLVLKASEETAGTAVEIIRALHDAGLPPGCVNLVFGVPAEISEQLLSRPQIRKISFTGSTPVGIHLMKLAANTVKRTTMELGGNAPVILFGDADYDLALSTLAASKFRNAGQVCISPARFFIHESLHDRFAKDMTERASALKLEHGLNQGVGMGPLANPRRLDAMERIIADADARGGSIKTGGRRVAGGGNFFQPTVVTGLADNALLFQEETFGPIVPISPFREIEDVIARANQVEAGLAGYVFTRSIGNAQRAMDCLEVGMLGINTMGVSTPETPFGGVKQSGHGSEGGIEGLQAFLHTRFVAQV